VGPTSPVVYKNRRGTAVCQSLFLFPLLIPSFLVRSQAAGSTKFTLTVFPPLQKLPATMFFSPSAVLALFFSVFLVGQVAAVPLPMPMVAAIERSLKRQTPPVEVASKSDGGVVTAYKRQTPPPVEVAAKSDGGAIVPYKRQTPPPVEVAAKSDGGAIVPYKRQTPPPVEVAAKSDGGDVVPYKRQTPDVQSPSKSDGGAILPYKRGAEIPSQLAVKSVDGVIELF